MKLALALLILIVASPRFSSGQQPGIQPDTKLFFHFDNANESEWDVVNDGVMGGRSKGYVEVKDGTLKFWGNLVTRGGGFTSIRAFETMNLDEFDGLELRVRGSGRDFEVELSDGVRYRGRQVSQRSGFSTTEEWSIVRIPFDSFRASIFGRPVRAEKLNTAKIRQIGIYMLDGIDGPFELEVDGIWAYKNPNA